ncbi:response regulator transcription factor [Candidatus Thiosymbion oneisti]|uniref:response regulator transcription factor n=1 Tax=Candidatus Thiosymbion oneisti TaxID=589554 RepID=UPI00105EA34F|nr:response regulator transcription factor [Candidatus Thiosymbion oneisti]
MTRRNTLQEHQKTSVVIAEDEMLLAGVLPNLLHTTSYGRIEVIETCSSQSQLSRTLMKLKPNVLLCDIWMPKNHESLPTPYDASSLQALKRQSPNTAILLLSGNPDAALVKNLLDSGANGFISKGVSPGQICQAIRQVRKGNRYVEPRLQTAIDLLNVNSSKSIHTQLLAGRRGDVLRLLLEGLSSKQIADALPVGRKHVEKKIAEVKSILGVETHIGILRMCIKLGITQI